MTGSWVEYAACRTHHADLWFADPGHETGQQAPTDHTPPYGIEVIK